MFGVDALGFGTQCPVVGLPVMRHPFGDLIGCWLLAIEIDRLTGELHDRTKPGRVLAGIKRNIIRRAIEIDHIARVFRHQY